eukprot:m.219677 g.219677  ORF g.219677 m.219677 type:complete len:70 (-) comp17003_c5_seq3:2347-2556(-)
MDDELAVLNQSVLTEEFILPLPEHSDSAVQGELLTLQQTFLIPHTSISRSLIRCSCNTLHLIFTIVVFV